MGPAHRNPRHCPECSELSHCMCQSSAQHCDNSASTHSQNSWPSLLSQSPARVLLGSLKLQGRFHKQATSGSSQSHGKKNSLLPSSDVQGKENIFQKLSSTHRHTLRFLWSCFISFVCLLYVPQAGFKLTL